MGLDGHLELQAHAAEASKLKSRLMQRILVNDAEIRQLAEPWLVDLDHTLAARPRVLH
jgi:flagellar protein FliT